MGRNDGPEVFLEDVFVFLERRVGVEEDDALLFEVFANLVVHDLGLVLGGNTGDEALALGLGNPESFVRATNVFGKVFP
ncbi:MAG: hypothetical protein RJA31_1074 [Actinomycetota bacterium]